jgi:hypothetical protein
VYLYKSNIASRIIILAKYQISIKINLIYLEELSEENINKIKQFSYTKTLPLLQSGELNISGVIPITKFILSLNKQIYNILLGENFILSSSIDMWIDYVNFRLKPIEGFLINNGKVDTKSDIAKIALIDFENILNELNEHLKFRSFMVLHSVTLVDLYLIINLVPYFLFVLNKNKLMKFPNIYRLFNYVFKLKMINGLFENDLALNIQFEE